MTIGQRIAEERKRLGLSQEALGERLGVSRQAISKWESDASVPEIDKLIVLSKLFSVSVGWLLGVEDPSAAEEAVPEETVAEPKASFWQELHQGLQERGWFPWETQTGGPWYWRLLRWFTPRRFGIVLLVLVQLFLYWRLIWCYNAAEDARMYAGFAEHTADQLELEMEALRRDFLRQQELEPGTLLSVYNFDTVYPENGEKATIAFSAVPYEWQEGDSGALYIQGRGIPTVQIPCQWDGAFLTCFTQMELRNGIELCFAIEHADGSRQFQGLYDDYLQNTDFAEAPLITGSVQSAQYDPKEKTFLVQQLEANFSRSEVHTQSSVTWQTWALLLLADGQEVGRHTLFDANIQRDSTRTGGGGGIEATRKELPLMKDVVLKEGQTVELVAYGEFSNGISSRELLQRWILGADGELEPAG